jgi:PAS domain S-box-containing protein
LIRQNIAKIRQHGGLAFETRHRHRNGEIREVRVSARLINVQQRDYIAAVWGDITETKLAGKKIREQADMLNLAHDAITIRDLDGLILYWNRSAERIYGWNQAEAIGKSAQQLLKLDPIKVAEARQLLLEKGYWTGELTAHTKDGREVLVESSWTLVRDNDGRPKSILAFSVDITEQRRLEQQVTRNQRLESLGTLSSGIAHDLNNILTPIMVSIGLLKEQTHEPVMSKLIAGLESSTQRGAQLVKQILTFSRGIRGERIPIGLRNIAREIQLLIQETFPKTIEFESHLPASLWLITGDPTQIHQVLLNLAINARDAMPNGGKLSITFENTVVEKTAAALNSEIPPGSYVLMQITDTGIGMTPKVIERIFEPFFSTKPHGQGTGLGLSTTLGIVKGHSGFINVYSEPGHGSTFKVYLPARVGSESTESEIAGENALRRGNSELILLVDDEDAICTTVKKILERFGYHAITAANGAEAVALYTAHGSEIAAVITDMHMPIMDGPATIAALRSLNPNVKIIVSSGLATNAGFAKAANIGARHFVPKPYSAEKILRTLNDLLGKSEADENSPSI